MNPEKQEYRKDYPIIPFESERREAGNGTDTRDPTAGAAEGGANAGA
jgi:hypothetical protein